MILWHQFQNIFLEALTTLASAFEFLGDHKWAAAIVALTVIVKTLLLPLTIKQVKSFQAMSRMQPEINRLKQKYKNDKEKLNREMMALMQREGANPLGGCLPLLAQMPVLWAMYYVIQKIDDPIAKGGLGVKDIPFLGLGDLLDPAKSSAAGILLLILMTGLQVLSARQMASAQSPDQARLAQIMPVMFAFIFLGWPAALVLYWAVQNGYQLAQQTIMLKTKFIAPPPPREKAKDAGKPPAGKPPAGRPDKGKGGSRKR